MEILLDVLKWSAVIGAAVLMLTLLKPILAQRYSARWRYWTWLIIAVLALLAPVQWDAFLPAAPNVPTPPIMLHIPDMEVQVSRTEGTQVSIQPVQPLPETDPLVRSWKLDDLLPLLWLSGMLLFTLYHLLGTLLFQHKVRRWRCKPSANTIQVYESVCRDLSCKNPPPLWISAAAGSPMLLGIPSPCLFLPNENWQTRELTFILRHELTHFQRHDLVYKLILFAANAVHWFNPLLYLLVREAGAAIELTCDDVVVAGANSETRRAYSETLLSAVHRGNGSALSTHFYGGKQIMKDRFRNILGKRGRKWGVLVLALTLLATAAAACAIGVQKTDSGDSVSHESGPDLHIVSEYIDTQIAALAQRGSIVTGQREKFILETVYDGDFYEDEIQVWRLDYALYLEDPDSFIPIGSESVDADGWLTGMDSLGDPYFILAMNRNTEKYELLEIAYSNVQWELGYSWAEYIPCHTILGMDLVPVLNGWPEASTQFLADLRDGHETWSQDWEDVALSYLITVLGEEPPSDELKTLYSWESTGEEGHDESRLVSVQCDQRTAYFMLARVVYPVQAWDTELSFWQVVGFCWQREAEETTAAGPLSAAELAVFADYFNCNSVRNGLLRFPYNRIDEIPDFWSILFYDAGELVTSDTELAAVADLYGGELELDCLKLNTDFILNCLNAYVAANAPIDREWFDQNLAERMQPLYLQEYDAYYLVHGDTNMMNYEFSSGERADDGTILLYYDSDIWFKDSDNDYDIQMNQPMCVVLCPNADQGNTENRWQIVRNEWLNAQPE